MDTTFEAYLETFNLQIPTNYEASVQFILSFLNLSTAFDKKTMVSSENQKELSNYFKKLKHKKNPADDPQILKWFQDKPAAMDISNDSSSSSDHSIVDTKINAESKITPLPGYSHFLEIATLKEQMKTMKVQHSTDVAKFQAINQSLRNDLSETVAKMDSLTEIVHEFLDFNNTKHHQQDKEYLFIKSAIEKLQNINKRTFPGDIDHTKRSKLE